MHGANVFCFVFLLFFFSYSLFFFRTTVVKDLRSENCDFRHADSESPDQTAH